MSETDQREFARHRDRARRRREQRFAQVHRRQAHQGALMRWLPAAAHRAPEGGPVSRSAGRATWQADPPTRLWDLTDRAQPRPLGSRLTGHTDAVFSVAFAPDGRTLATASVDRTVRFVRPHQPRSTSPARATRPDCRPRTAVRADPRQANRTADQRSHQLDAAAPAHWPPENASRDLSPEPPPCKA